MPLATPDWLAHANELRRRILLVCGYFLLMVVLALTWVNPLLYWLTADLPQKLQFLGPTDILWVYLLLCGVSALILTIPVAAYHVWRFVAPGLHPHERRVTLLYIPALTVLFILGLSFGYGIVYPMVLAFLTHLAGEQFILNYTAERYFHFIFTMTVPFGFLFEMPAVMMFLTKLRIVNPRKLASMRKQAYFILILVAVTLTPPDLLSDVLVIVPLLLLYEGSIALSRLVYRPENPVS